MREQVVKRRSKGHGVDDKFAVVGEGQDDHFKELAIAARDRSRAPSADLRRGPCRRRRAHGRRRGRPLLRRCRVEPLIDETPPINRNTSIDLPRRHGLSKSQTYLRESIVRVRHTLTDAMSRVGVEATGGASSGHAGDHGQDLEHLIADPRSDVSARCGAAFDGNGAHLLDKRIAV